MPALFAYLVAVGLLLGGGYGALSWLAAPEPVKVVAKAKPKPPSRDEANSDATLLANSSATDQAASRSNDQPSPASSEPIVAASEQGAPPQLSEPSQAQQTGANPEIVPAAAQTEVGQPALAVLPVSTSHAQAAATFPRTAAATTARPVKRPHLRQANSRSEKSRLTLMTLRTTIEFPDGRRVTQLIPYRSGGRVLAFQPDD